MRRLLLILTLAVLATPAAASASRFDRHGQHRPQPAVTAAGRNAMQNRPLKRGRGPKPAPQPTGSVQAAAAQSGDASVSGDGDIVVSLNGTIIGTLGSGRIEIVSARQQPQVTVSGGQCIARGRSVEICVGTNLSFSVMNGTFKLTIAGANIHASIVGQGSVSARGSGSTVVNGTTTVAWSLRKTKPVLL